MHTLKRVTFVFSFYPPATKDCTYSLNFQIFSYSTLASTMYILIADISFIYSAAVWLQLSTFVDLYDMLQLYWTLMRTAHLLFVYVPTNMSETSSWSLLDSRSQTDTSSLASTGFFCTWVAFRLRCLRTRQIVTTTTITMMIITTTPMTITRRGILVSPAGSLLACSAES